MVLAAGQLCNYVGRGGSRLFGYRPYRIWAVLEPCCLCCSPSGFLGRLRFGWSWLEFSKRRRRHGLTAARHSFTLHLCFRRILLCVLARFTVFLELDQHYIPQFPQVMNLTDHEINVVKNILDSSRKRRDYQLAERAANKIKDHLKIENDLSPFDFLEILLKDYNSLSAE